MGDTAFVAGGHCHHALYLLLYVCSCRLGVSASRLRMRGGPGGGADGEAQGTDAWSKTPPRRVAWGGAGDESRGAGQVTGHVGRGR